MIGSIKGNIIHQTEQSVIIETPSGVGYRVFVGKQTLPETVRLFTHHHIREDSSDLYGFSHFANLEMFELLLNVSGVGPKVALALVTTLGRETITQAIIQNQPATFQTVSGIGQKVAEKIIVELRNKVSSSSIASTPFPEQDQLVDALLGFGYRQQEIAHIMPKLDLKAPMHDKLKQALRLLAK